MAQFKSTIEKVRSENLQITGADPSLQAADRLVWGYRTEARSRNESDRVRDGEEAASWKAQSESKQVGRGHSKS